MKRVRYTRSPRQVATLIATLAYLSFASPVYAYSFQDTPAKTTTSTVGTETSPEATAESNLVVTNNTAVVRFSPSAWDRLPLIGAYTANETVFQVRATSKDVPSALITSSGLGNAVFIREGTQEKRRPVEGLLAHIGAAWRGIRGCPEDSWTGAPSLFLSDLKIGQDVKVRMRFPCNLVSDPSDSLEGKILVIAAQQKPLEVPLKIQTPASSSVYTALVWLLTLLIPAFIGYVIYKAQHKWSEHRTQWATLEKYTVENHTILADFFGVYYTEAVKSADRDFAQNLRGEFVTRNWVANIPPREWRKIEKAIGDCDRKAIKKHLARLFPSWRKHIKDAR